MALKLKKTKVVHVVVTGRKRADFLAQLAAKKELVPISGFFLYGVGRFEGCFTEDGVKQIESHLRKT